jgi:hypothetical protein
MHNRLSVIAFLFIALMPLQAQAYGTVTPVKPICIVPRPICIMPKVPLQGDWTYRSYIDDTGSVFGEGTMHLTVSSTGVVGGNVDFGGGDVLDITGQTSCVCGSYLYMKGTGRAGTGTAGWIYEYRANPEPVWPAATDKRVILIGTVLRTVAHDGQPAGYTATFEMVPH